MNELETFVISYLASKGLDRVFAKIRTMVLRGCTEKRAAHFFESFLKEIKNSQNSNKSLTQILDKYFEDEESRECIFSAYRRVVFSASKEIGPRIIGLITASSIIHGPDRYDEKLCLAAEEFADDDFKELEQFLKTNELSSTKTQIRFHYDGALSDPLVTNCSLRAEWENWRVKLFRLGLYDEWAEFNVQYKGEDGERFAGINTKQTSVIEFGSEVFCLIDYYKKVIGETEG